jgi:GNAT superfamily N-acetyltransferase
MSHDDPPESTMRIGLRPGDVERIVEFHRDVYGREHAFDDSFAGYVAGPLREFAARLGPNERIWIAEHGDRLAGCIAIVRVDPAIAQLRWFLVGPEFRGYGLGTTLLQRAVSFSRLAAYERVILWTESVLTAAARLYRAAGFELVEQRPGLRWGVEVVEARYELHLSRQLDC